MTTELQSQLTWREMLQPDHLLSGILAGLVTSVIAISLGVALAVLVYSGNVDDDFLYRMIGLVLFATMWTTGLTALTSSFPGSIAFMQESPVAILALLAAVLSEEMAESASAEEQFYTIVAVAVMATAMTSLVFWLLGYFQLGNLVRYIPFPVIGGFLAGTGVLLVQGGLSLMIDAPVDYQNLTVLAETDMVVKWLPGMALALLLFRLSRQSDHFLVVPGTILGAFALFYVVLMLTGTSVDAAADKGWLLQALPEDTGTLLKPLSPDKLDAVDQGELVHHLPHVTAVAVVAAIALLLNVTGMELTSDDRLDINRELKVGGGMNFLSALSGGLPAFHSLSASTLAHRISPNSRVPGLVVAIICGIIVLVGGSLLSYFPRLLLGGLVCLVGIDFIVSWFIETWDELSILENSIIIVIVVVITVVGFLEAVGIGLVFAVILFVMEYSRVEVIRYSQDGQTIHSNMLRSPLHTDLLHKHGRQVIILRLQGYLFFGTTHRLVEEAESQIAHETADMEPIRYLVLDFRHVTGLDSSSVRSFDHLVRMAKKREMALVLCDLKPEIAHKLETRILSWAGCHVFSNLDYGLQWIEDQIVASHGTPESLEAHTPISKQLETMMPALWTQRLMGYMDRIDAKSGAVIIQQGDPSPGLLFVETGQVTVRLEHVKGSATRIRTMGAGTLVGEIGAYLGQPASASVVADQDCVIYRMTVEAVRKIEADDPQLAAAFHRFMAHFLARRLTRTTETLSAYVE